MEADISTLRKTGHFYFALTRRETKRDTKRHEERQVAAQVLWRKRSRLSLLLRGSRHGVRVVNLQPILTGHLPPEVRPDGPGSRPYQQD